MELAALATAAVPGLSPTGAASVSDDARDFTSAIVHDAEGNRWRIRSPQHQEAAMRLETELQVLRGFSTAIRAELPFRVPSVAGAVRRGELRTFVYNHLPGHQLSLSELASGSTELIDNLARSMGTIHQMSESVVDQADLPRYSAERFRQRRLNELDQAATTGKIPATLLRRWEHAMEDRQLWNFTPVVTHGDLHEDNLLFEDNKVVAITGWTDLHIGDPADDFSWLTASPNPDLATKILDSYSGHISGEVDPYIMRRATLTAEFALAQWLVRGLAHENEDMVEEALTLLKQLAHDVDTYGGHLISASAREDDATDDSATQDSKPVVRASAKATIVHLADGGSASSPAEDEPAVITDLSAGSSEPSVSDSSAPERPSNPVVQLPVAHWNSVAESEDETGAFPAIDQAETPTGVFPPVKDVEEQPAQALKPAGPLPIHPTSESESQAKQKNYFPAASANSAKSAGSARSAESARSTGSAHSAASARSAHSAHSAAGADELETSSESPSHRDQVDETGESIYSRHPGLRPPTS